MDEYYRVLESEECVPAGFARNPNVSVIPPMMLHEDEATAIHRGIDGISDGGVTSVTVPPDVADTDRRV
ncbi:hypothetical protein [Actinomadura napierensis]|uniref:Uncharacterized protein n=1 Tax=Actinomadura napierensis TaxID=267854 RepID=A0ABP5K4P0_9ACTN